MARLLGNSSMPNYVKVTATVLLGATYLAALSVAADTYISYGPTAQLPTIVSFVLGTGIGLALQTLGLHTGASLVEAPSTGFIQPNTTSTTLQSNITTTKDGDHASTSTP